MNPHGIFKYHQVAHQEFAWYLRTLPQISQIFADVWDTNTNNLVCGFDGACYMDKRVKKILNVGLIQIKHQKIKDYYVIKV